MSAEHRSKGRGSTNRVQRSGRSSYGYPSAASTTNEIYRNDRFTHFLCALTGKRVHLEVKNGKFYDGVLTTVSPNCEFVLSKVHMVEVGSNGKADFNKVPNQKSLFERIVFKHKDIVDVTCPGVDLDECKKGDSFQTDTSISHCLNGEVKERELQPWQPGDNSQDSHLLGVQSEKSNGWGADVMFKVNAERYGVTSTYDGSMDSYTTTLEKKDTEEYLQMEKQAAKLAKEIEQDQQFNNHIDSGKTEEELYSSVVRQPTTGNRYVPPQARGRQPVNIEPRKTPSPHANSPVNARKTNGAEDARQQTNDSEQPKVEVQESKGEVKSSQDVRCKINTEQIREEILSAKPHHVKMEELTKVQQKPVKKRELYKFANNFNLNLNSEQQNKGKKAMPETQDIRKLEEREKLQNKEAASIMPTPVTTVQATPSSTTPPLHHENKAPSTTTTSKPSTSDSTETSPAVKSTLNPNAKEFKLNPNAKPFSPKPSSPSQSQGIPTPVQMPTSIPPMSANSIIPSRMPSYPAPHRPRARMSFPPHSDYDHPTTSIMTASLAAGAPIIAPQAPVVFQHFVPSTGLVPPMPLQHAPMNYAVFPAGQQRFIQPQVNYNMAMSGTPSGMASTQGTMATAGSFQPGSFQEGIPVYVSQAGTMAAHQSFVAGPPQPYQQHVMPATTPTGHPPHQSPQPHPQPIFFQMPQQAGGSQPPPNQPQQHILQPAPSGVGMGQPPPPAHPTMIMMPQSHSIAQQASAYIR